MEAVGEIASAFPGLFRWNDLWAMSPLVLMYWRIRAHRCINQNTARIAQAVRIGMCAEEVDFQKAIESWTLTPAERKAREQERQDSTWKFLRMRGRG